MSAFVTVCKMLNLYCRAAKSLSVNNAMEKTSKSRNLTNLHIYYVFMWFLFSFIVLKHGCLFKAIFCQANMWCCNKSSLFCFSRAT